MYVTIELLPLCFIIWQQNNRPCSKKERIPCIATLHFSISRNKKIISRLRNYNLYVENRSEVLCFLFQITKIKESYTCVLSINVQLLNYDKVYKLRNLTEAAFKSSALTFLTVVLLS
jgi:hypothetical protein